MLVFVVSCVLRTCAVICHLIISTFHRLLSAFNVRSTIIGSVYPRWENRYWWMELWQPSVVRIWKHKGCLLNWSECGCAKSISRARLLIPRGRGANQNNCYIIIGGSAWVSAVLLSDPYIRIWWPNKAPLYLIHIYMSNNNFFLLLGLEIRYYYNS